MSVNKVFVVQSDGFFIFKCPHCNQQIIVKCEETRCNIFRCGIIKSNGKQIGPHTKKVECDRLTTQDLIFGCSKPFRFFYHKDGNYVEPCAYI